MAIYEVDEFTFDVPDGYVDRSINIFVPPAGMMKRTPQSIIITREPRTEDTVGQQAGKLLKEFASKVPGVKLLGQRERVIGALAGREARVHATRDGVPIYQRYFFIGHYGTFLSFLMTSTRAQSAQCDGLAERVLSTVRLRKR